MTISLRHAGPVFAVLTAAHLAAALRWTTDWKDYEVGGQATLSWTDNSPGDLFFKSSRKDREKGTWENLTYTNLETSGAYSQAQTFDLPERIYRRKKLAHDARYWFEITLDVTGETDTSPDYYFTKDKKYFKLGDVPDENRSDGDGKNNNEADKDTPDSSTTPTTEDLSTTGDSATTAPPDETTAGGGADNNEDEEEVVTVQGGSASSSDNQMRIGVGVGVGVGGLLILCAITWFIMRRRKRAKHVTMGDGAVPSELSSGDEYMKAGQGQEMGGSQIYEKPAGNVFPNELPAGTVEAQQRKHQDEQRYEMPG